MFLLLFLLLAPFTLVWCESRRAECFSCVISRNTEPTNKRQEAATRASVSLLIFSGLPDPSWSITGEQVASLNALLRSLSARDAPPTSAPALGFRGFAVRFDNSSTLTAANGTVVAASGAALADASRSVERFLLASAGSLIASTPVLAALAQELAVSAPATNAPANATRFVWCAAFCVGFPNVEAQRVCRASACERGEELLASIDNPQVCQNDSATIDANVEDCAALAEGDDIDWLIFIIAIVASCAFICLLLILYIVFLRSLRTQQA